MNRYLYSTHYRPAKVTWRETFLPPMAVIVFMYGAFRLVFDTLNWLWDRL